MTVHTHAQPGTRDTNFSSFITASDQSVIIRDVHIRPDGKLLIGGSFSTVNGSGQSAIARLETNGFRDSSFSSTARRFVNAVTVDQSNRVLIVGLLTNVNGLRATNIARLSPHGINDPSFTPRPLPGELQAVASLADGKILIGGDISWRITTNVSTTLYLLRLNEDGSADDAFSPARRGPDGTVYSFALQPDGGILVGGAFRNFDGEPRAGLVRLNPDTTLDTNFSCSITGVVYSIAIQPDGKVLAAGSFRVVNGARRAALARLNPDGSLDTAFDAGVESPSTSVLAVAVDAAGHIYMGGTFTAIRGTPRNNFARLHPNGVLDTGFAPLDDGPNSTVWTIAPQPDEKVVIGGMFGSYDNLFVGQLTRILAGPSIPAAPQITRPLISAGATAGNSVRMSVEARGGPTLHYYWFKDGVELPGFRDYAVWSTNYALPQHTGHYTVLVSNELGTATTEGSLTVQFAAPGFTVEPTNLTLLAGQTLRLTASATGAPSPSIRWQLNGTDVHNGNTLRITNVNFSHAGDYIAIASNAIAFTTSAVARVTINAAPTNAGAVDVSFYPPPSSASGGTSAAVIQPDGKVIIAGGSAIGAGGSGNIRRLHPDGAIDITFNTNAVVDGSVACLALQNDGKIVVGGYFAFINGVPRYQLARLHADGTLDTNFTPQLSTYFVKRVAVQPDGKIVVASDTASFSQQGLVLGRVLSDGSHDPNFKPVLRSTSGGTLPQTITIAGLSLQPDNKILLASSLGVQRFLSHGSIDLSFSATNLPMFVRAMAPANDGKVFIAGTSDLRPTVRRLNSHGSLDSNYVSTVSNSVQAIALQPDGKLLVALQAADVPAPAPQMRIRRLNADGSPDPSFTTAPSAAGQNLSISSILLKRDCEILVVGSFVEFGGYSRPGIVQLHNDPPRLPEVSRQPLSLTLFEGQTASFSVDATCRPTPSFQWYKDGLGIPGATSATLRLIRPTATSAGDYTVIISNVLGAVTSSPATLTVNPAPTNAGSLDLSFRTGSGPNDTIYTALVQPDGKILIGGLFTEVDGVPRGRVARLNSDGSLDLSFDPGSGAAGFNVPEVRALALQPDGKVLVGGYFALFAGLRHTCVARLHPDGSVDTTFATNRFSSTTPAYLPTYSIALQADNKILVGIGGSGWPGVQRLTTNGLIDNTFSPGSVQPSTASVYSLVVQPDGRILCGGDVDYYNGSPAWTFWRLNTNGSVNATLGSWPRFGITYSIQAGPNSHVIAGSFPMARSNAVLRIQPDGTLAPNWQFQRISAPAYSALVDECDRILLGGGFTDVSGTPARGLVRLTGSGAIDRTFAPIPLADGAVRSVLALSHDRYLVAGDFSEINNVVQPGIALIVARVDGPPLVTMPTNQTGLAGMDFDLISNVDCAPETTFQWIRNGIPLPGATNSTLAFPNPRLAANGEYRLIAQNQFGSTTSGVTAVSLAMPPTMPGRNDIDFYPDRSIYPYIRAMTLQEDGKIVLSLPRSTNNLVRLNLDGSLDTSFVITNRFYSPSAILAHKDGRLLVVDYETVRLLENGSVDPSFNVVTNYETRVVATQADGKYILVSPYPPGNSSRYIVRRFTSSGDLDTNWIAHQLDSYPEAIALRPDGKVLVGGYFTNLWRGSTPISWPGRLVQFHPDGSLDTNFVPRFPSAYNAVLGLAIERQGTVLAGGFFSAYAGVTAAANLVRLLSNGAPDLSLSNAASNTIVEDIALQPDGKIVIATGQSGSLLASKGVVRLHENGTYDSTFDSGLGTRRNLAPVGALYLAVTQRGKIYAGGYFSEYDGFVRPGLVRIHGDPEMPVPFALGSAFQTSIYTDLGRTYYLETTRTTYFTNWSVVHSLSGNASTQTLSDPNPPTPPQFYRLRVE